MTWTEIVHTLVIVFVETACCKIFFDAFCQQRDRDSKWKNRILFLALYVGYVGIAVIGQNNNIIKISILLLLMISVMAVLYKGSKMFILLLSVTYCGLGLVIDRILLILIEIFFAERLQTISDDPIKVMVLVMLCKMVLFLCVIIIRSIFSVRDTVPWFTTAEWLRFLFFPCMTIVSMTAFAVAGEKGNSVVVVFSVGLVLTNFVFLYMLQDIVERERIIQDNRVAAEKAKNQLEMYRCMEEVYAEQRKKVHEFKNHIGCIQGLLEDNRCEEAYSYAKRINNSWISEVAYIRTGNAIVNAVLNQKFRSAKEKEIPMLLSIGELEGISVAEEDMVTLLANLLDNAIEACMRVKDRKPVIQFQLHVEQGKMFLVVRNTAVEPVRQEHGRIVTTKKNVKEHGIGLKNIESVIHKYHGEGTYSWEEGYFIYTVII